MKKTIRAVSVCLVVVMIISTLVACSPSVEEVVGTYSGSYTYNGNRFNVVIMLYDDGTYVKAIGKNGSVSSVESGDYEIRGNEIRLYDSDTVVEHGSWTDYKYSKDTLENNGNKLTKENE